MLYTIMVTGSIWERDVFGVGETSMTAFVEQVTDPAALPASAAHILRAPSLEPPMQPPDGTRLTAEAPPRDRQAALLQRLVETEILPRLAVARRATANQ